MSRTWIKPALLVVGVVVVGVLVTLSAYGLVAMNGSTATPADGQAATPDGSSGDSGGQASGGDASTSEKRALPGRWKGYKWYDKDLRGTEDMKFRDPDAGEEIKFVPKQMNNSTLPEKQQRRELIKYGRKLMANTSEMMPQHVGNDLSCANCHGGGSLPTTTGMVGQDISMIPFVGTAAGYPEWTGRTQRMRDMRLRIMGCFLRSMNSPGAAKGMPNYTSREVQAMEAYLVWLDKDTPSQMVPYWRHLDKPTGENKKPVPEVNPVRGAELYLENCASCHGADGQGKEGQYPPLWGPGSFNDGAGMGRMYTSAAFIREAMPYGAGHSFKNWSDVQDVAGFMNAHKRPHLPRQPKDWKEAGVKKEGIYYQRAQEYWGYDMNPMTKKLMMAGIPIGTQNVSQEDIPDNVGKYDQPLKDAEVDGSWETTWIETYKWVGNNSTAPQNSSASVDRARIEDALSSQSAS